MSTEVKTIAIVEDESDLRQTLADLIAQFPEWTLIATYPNAELALPALTEKTPDLVLMDIQLPGKSGIECTAALKTARPEVQILMITVFDDTDPVFEALSAGASGYLLKRDVPTRLRESMEDVLAGGSPVSSSVARKVFQHFMQPTQAPQHEDYKLTQREQEILDMLVKGLLYKEIAYDLHISRDTVRFHLRNIYTKLHVRTRTEAVVKYLGR